MASNLSYWTQDALFCGDIGTNSTIIDCCYKDPVDDCDFLFDPSNNWLKNGCASGDCAVDCQNLSNVYANVFLPNSDGVNPGAITAWTTCLNVPNMAGYLQQNALAPNVSDVVKTYIPEDISTEDLQNITKAVTMCLSTTCNNARNTDICSDACSPTKLLTNQTMPNYAGVNDCLFSLCTNGYQAVPFANADIIGIGVFSSYIMQCGIILLLWAGFLAFAFLRISGGLPRKEAAIKRQQEMLVTGLIEFHKAQCFFSSTIQIASLAYGLYTTNLLTVFLVIPLATNGIIPVIFGHLLVLRYGRSSVYLTSLTCISWVLSSLVYWSLYMHIITVDWNTSTYDVYENIFYELSANVECCGYSVLAVCPENLILGVNSVASASTQIRALTPILWTFGTLVLFTLIAYQIFKWLLRRKHNEKAAYVQKILDQDRNAIQTSFLRAALSTDDMFWITTLAFVAAMGMQLSLLYVEVNIDMLDYTSWSFGQIVAITIWVPPLAEYLYLQLRVEEAAEHRLAKTIKVSRVRRSSEEHLPLKQVSSRSSRESLHMASVPDGEHDSHQDDSGGADHRQTKRWSNQSRSSADEDETEALNPDSPPHDDEG